MRERSTREPSSEVATAERAEELEAPVHERYVGGAVPPPGTTSGAPGTTASTLAYADAGEDKNVEELKTKVAALCAKQFDGDYKKMYERFGGDKGGVTKGGLVDLLSEAGVGNGLTRGMWASKIIEKLDANADGKIDWAEFESVFKSSAVAAA